MRRLSSRRAAFGMAFAVCLAVAVCRIERYQLSVFDALDKGLGVPESLLVLAFAAFAAMVIRRPVRKDWPLALMAVAFSGLLVGTTAVVRLKSVSRLFWGASALVTLFDLAVFAVAFWAAFVGVYEWLSDWGRARGAARVPKGVLSCDISEWGRAWKWVFRLAPAIFILGWAPVVAAQLPGTPCGDMNWMLAQYLGIDDVMTTHHPLAATLLYGAVFSLGNSVAGLDAGVLLATVMQVLAMAFALSYELRVMKLLGAPRLLVGVAVAFFALNPVLAGYAQFMAKDALFSAAFALYASLVALYMAEPARFAKSWRGMSLLLAAALATGLLRNNGFYVVMLSLPFLAFAQKGAKARALALVPLMLAVALVPVINVGLMKATDAKLGSAAEAFSIPFQQTARYAITHPDDVEEWEREAIQGVLDYENIAELYNEHKSDPVKQTYKSSGSMRAYARAWVAQGSRHPGCYADALAVHMAGYFNLQTADLSAAVNHIVVPMANRNFEWNKWVDEDIRQAVIAAIDKVELVPFAGMFANMGIYVWGLLAGVALALRAGGWRRGVCLMPQVVLLLTCLAGPLAGSIRYGLGVIMTLPLIVAAVLYAMRGVGADGGPMLCSETPSYGVSEGNSSEIGSDCTETL